MENNECIKVNINKKETSVTPTKKYTNQNKKNDMFRGNKITNNTVNIAFNNSMSNPCLIQNTYPRKKRQLTKNFDNSKNICNTNKVLKKTQKTKSGKYRCYVVNSASTRDINESPRHGFCSNTNGNVKNIRLDLETKESGTTRREKRKVKEVEKELTNECIKKNHTTRSLITLKRLNKEKSQNYSENNKVSFNLTKTNFNKLTNPKNKNKSNSIDLYHNNKYSHLTIREKAFMILMNSPLLHLNERLYFSRSTQSVRALVSKYEILNTNCNLLKEKIKELKSKINIYDSNIRLKFSATKTAEITLNLIGENQEDEFKNFKVYAENENDRKKYYLFLRIVYLLLNENSEGIEDKNLKTKLYQILKAKGYISLRDYLYKIYIKSTGDNNIIENINKINEILIKHPGILDCGSCLHINRFMSFTSFLISELITYANKINDYMELKEKSQNIIDVIYTKIDKYKNKYGKK